MCVCALRAGASLFVLPNFFPHVAQPVSVTRTTDFVDDRSGAVCDTVWGQRAMASITGNSYAKSSSALHDITFEMVVSVGTCTQLPGSSHCHKDNYKVA